MLLSVLSVAFLSLCRAFQLNAPSQVQVNVPTNITWSRNSTDASKFVLVIKTSSTLSESTVDSNGRKEGRTSVVFPNVGQSRLEAYPGHNFSYPPIVPPLAKTSIRVIRSSSTSQPTKTSTTEPSTTFTISTTSLPSGLPSNIYGQGGPSSGGPGMTLVGILFDQALNWRWVAGNSDSSAQIFAYIPAICAVALGISSSQIKTYGLQVNIPASYKSPADVDQLGTIWLGYLPSDSVDELASQIKILTSPFYKGTENPVAQSLAGHVVPGFAVNSVSDPREADSTSTSTTSSSTSTNSTSTNVKPGVLAGATVGTAVFVLILLLGIFLIQRRKSRKSIGVAASLSFSQHDAPSTRIRWEATPFTERKEAPIFYPEKSPSRAPSPSTTETSTVFGSIMTTRQHRLQSRIDALIAHTTVLEVALTAANENARDRSIEIERLRQLLQSDWALGLTDEPPPSYSDLIMESGSD